MGRGGRVFLLALVLLLAVQNGGCQEGKDNTANSLSLIPCAYISSILSCNSATKSSICTQQCLVITCVLLACSVVDHRGPSSHPGDSRCSYFAVRPSVQLFDKSAVTRAGI
jgi:hypothetical protein